MDMPLASVTEWTREIEFRMAIGARRLHLLVIEGTRQAGTRLSRRRQRVEITVTRY
jgi:hypothetical protein